MARLLIHVEGQTEEDFVNEALRDHLLAKGYDDVGARIAGHCCPANDLRPADKPFFLRELHGNLACRDLNGNWS
jgi:hypothetical protein